MIPLCTPFISPSQRSFENISPWAYFQDFTVYVSVTYIPKINHSETWPFFKISTLESIVENHKKYLWSVDVYRTGFQCIKHNTLSDKFGNTAQCRFQYCNSYICCKCCITQSISVTLIRDFSVGKYYYHGVLPTIKCIYDYYHFNFLTFFLLFNYY